MLCSKLHCQKVFDLILLSYKFRGGIVFFLRISVPPDILTDFWSARKSICGPLCGMGARPTAIFVLPTNSTSSRSPQRSWTRAPATMTDSSLSPCSSAPTQKERRAPLLVSSVASRSVRGTGEKGSAVAGGDRIKKRGSELELAVWLQNTASANKDRLVGNAPVNHAPPAPPLRSCTSYLMTLHGQRTSHRSCAHHPSSSQFCMRARNPGIKSVGAVATPQRLAELAHLALSVMPQLHGRKRVASAGRLLSGSW